MGVFSKLKGIFYDEVIEEDNSSEMDKLDNIVKKEEKPKIEEIKIRREIPEEVEEIKLPKEPEPTKMENTFNERELFRSERTFNFTEFDDDEVAPTPVRRNVLSEERVSRTEAPKVEEKPHTFKPSLVISPVWGVLDKDYKRDEVKERTEAAPTVKSAATTYDTVRRKAYGTLEDELEDTLNSMNKISTKTINDRISTVSSLEEKTAKIEDLINRIDDVADEIDKTMSIAQAEDSVKLDNFDDEDEKVLDNDKTMTDSTLEHDLFNLIDSMYDDKED